MNLSEIIEVSEIEQAKIDEVCLFINRNGGHIEDKDAFAIHAGRTIALDMLCKSLMEEFLKWAQDNNDYEYDGKGNLFQYNEHRGWVKDKTFDEAYDEYLQWRAANNG